MISIFIDSAVLIALNSPRDQSFSTSQQLLIHLQKNHAPLITTDYVIDEAVTHLLTAIKGGFHHTCNLLNWIAHEDNFIQIRWINKECFTEAIKVFRHFNKDKLWSFTDCTSYVVMKELKINTVFTFDEHFAQMGFKLLS